MTTVPTTTSFTYTTVSGLGLSGGGTWTLSTASLATAIQNALGALSVVGGAANVVVTGTGPYTVTFASAVANPTLLTVTSNAISSAPTITIVNPNAPAAVTDATLVLDYNANLLTITGGTVNSGLERGDVHGQYQWIGCECAGDDRVPQRHGREPGHVGLGRSGRTERFDAEHGAVQIEGSAAVRQRVDQQRSADGGGRERLPGGGVSSRH